MNELEEKYKLVLEESKSNHDIIGLFLGGSRGKSDDFITENSDMDVYIILKDGPLEELRKKLINYRTINFEIRVFYLSEFRLYAEWGTEMDWDRYNFSHNKSIIDKTGEIQELINEKGKIPEEQIEKTVEDSLDSYINSLYRSIKYDRDGYSLASYLDATESLPYLMTALYALEGRLKPYNKYFEWELKKYPLKFFDWSTEEFVSDYKKILQTGDIETQKKIYKTVKKIFLDQGFTKSIKGWEGYYFVGK